jgi:RNA polymerase sigma factor (TIGR02999 family)
MVAIFESPQRSAQRVRALGFHPRGTRVPARTNWFGHGFHASSTQQVRVRSFPCLAVTLGHVQNPGPQPDPAASPPPDELTKQVYDQLRAIAQAKLAAQGPGHTLQATALVHEVFLKFREHPTLWAGEPGRFFQVAAQAMRQVLVDHARARGRVKRGGGIRREFADVAELADGQNAEEIMALDEAISRLEVAEPQAAQVVKLRFFAGLTVEETATALAISERTVKRDWQFARAWLFRALE